MFGDFFFAGRVEQAASAVLSWGLLPPLPDKGGSYFLGAISHLRKEGTKGRRGEEMSFNSGFSVSPSEEG